VGKINTAQKSSGDQEKFPLFAKNARGGKKFCVAFF
jgi:hypothetical protein